MSGRKGALSQKATEIVSRYREDFLADMDGRCSEVRLLRVKVYQITADLGGWSNLSNMQRSLCERAVHMERQIEKMEKKLIVGVKVDLNQYTNLVATYSGLLSKINPGLKRLVKVLTLDDYQKAKGSEATKAAPATAPVHIVEKESNDHH